MTLRQNKNIKGIIFDMDNTLLQSNIDFLAMKRDIFHFLVEKKVLHHEFPFQDHTASTMIEYSKQIGLTEDMHQSVMQIAARHETIGMEGAGLEPGVKELLLLLYNKYKLVVVTNNSVEAANKALDITGIRQFFDLIVGREQMSALKPSPSGFFYVLNHYKQVIAEEWICIGDSWIDGKASMDAGIPFVSYVTGIDEMMRNGVEPIGQIDSIIKMTNFIC